MPLDSAQARRFYDWFGARQDSQARYEDKALDRLRERGRFACARRVFELGFGTGRLARRLLQHDLPPDARYVGQEVSTTMIELATARLAPWADRVSLRREQDLTIPDRDGAHDRFIATYVLDLMPEPDIREVLEEAHRVLEPGGLLCVVSLTHGQTVLSRAIAGIWRAIALRVPRWVGGCRPIEIREFLDGRRFELEVCEVVTAFGVASEVLVARAVVP